jgi:hypothetical protein
MHLQSINGAGNMSMDSMVSNPGSRSDTNIVAHRWHNFMFMPGKIETPKPSPSAKIIHFRHDMTVNRKYIFLDRNANRIAAGSLISIEFTVPNHETFIPMIFAYYWGFLWEVYGSSMGMRMSPVDSSK